MGGYGSGGHNKYCKTIEDYTRYKFDSYDFYEWLGYDKYIHYKENMPGTHLRETEGSSGKKEREIRSPVPYRELQVQAWISC